MIVLILLPDRDFDPTETAIPWSTLRAAGHEVRFATPSGAPGQADPRLIKHGFSVLSPLLMTKEDPLARYEDMTRDPHYQNPLRYEEVIESEFDGLIIPGGHAPGMKAMLESAVLQERLPGFFTKDKPVGAVCHGVLLLARTISPETGLSVLYGRVTTALPKRYEMPAWAITAPWLKRYYRTYRTSVQDEVIASLASEADFKPGPLLPWRDAAGVPGKGFTVRDGNYLSARWPGDCYRFAQEFASMLEEYREAQE